MLRKFVRIVANSLVYLSRFNAIKRRNICIGNHRYTSNYSNLVLNLVDAYRE